MHEYFFTSASASAAPLAASLQDTLPGDARIAILDAGSAAPDGRAATLETGGPLRTPSVRGPLSTTKTLYWTWIDGQPVASTSQGALRRLANSKLDEDRVRLALCMHLPGFLRQLPYWEDIRTVKPGYGLTFSEGRPVLLDPPPSVGEPISNLPDAARAMSAALRDSVERRTLAGGPVSADVSGGMDSTSLAFLLDSVQEGGIFYHASTDDQHNRDSEYARRAGAELTGRYVELDSLTSTSSAFGEPDPNILAVDEGPLAWAGNSRHLGALLGDAAGRGVRTHLTGIGGDELFDPLPAMALGLLSTPSWKSGVRILRRLGKMQRWPVLELGRAVAANVDFETELLRRAHNRGGPETGPGEAFAWAPGFGISRFATPEAGEVVAHKVREGLDHGVQPHHADRFKHQIMESLMFQGEIARQVNHAYGHLGVSWEAPFLDDELVRLVLSLPAEILLGARESKPLLARATEGVVPRWVFTREDKGEYSSDLFAEYKTRRQDLRRLFEDSYLVDMGHVDPVAIRDALSMPVTGTEELFELEHLASVERWVRRAI